MDRERLGYRICLCFTHTSAEVKPEVIENLCNTVASPPLIIPFFFPSSNYQSQLLSCRHVRATS